MHITGYSFGQMDIDDSSYHSDLIRSRAGVRGSWWPRQRHQLQVEDLADILAEQPEIVVVGTGYYGRLKVPESIRGYLADRGIELFAAKTSRAVERFNELQRENARIVGAFHLTC